MWVARLAGVRRVLACAGGRAAARGMAAAGAGAGAAERIGDTQLMQLARSAVPVLSDRTKHKGQAGRIGVIGGSLEYTGAPFFAAISALKVGADLVHVFCTQAAAPVIKSYSPELIVHPLLDQENSYDKIKPWLERLHILVIGPGLGRDMRIFNVVSNVIVNCNIHSIPLIIDADGLFLINQNIDLLHLVDNAIILTPNMIEFERLRPLITDQKEEKDFKIDYSGKDIGNTVAILRKGMEDEFFCSKPHLQWKSNTSGSGRRCGGQGDILSGTIAVFMHWCVQNIELPNLEPEDIPVTAASVACYAASTLVRNCNARAFKLKGRSMLASDMVEHIHDAFDELFETKD